jgi:hypothetical protein
MAGAGGLRAGRGPVTVDEEVAVRMARMLESTKAGTISFFIMTPPLPEIPN